MLGVEVDALRRYDISLNCFSYFEIENVFLHFTFHLCCGEGEPIVKRRDFCGQKQCEIHYIGDGFE